MEETMQPERRRALVSLYWRDKESPHHRLRQDCPDSPHSCRCTEAEPFASPHMMNLRSIFSGVISSPVWPGTQPARW